MTNTKQQKQHWNKLTDVQQAVCQAECSAGGQHSDSAAIAWAWKKHQNRQKFNAEKTEQMQTIVKRYEAGFVLVNNREFSKDHPVIAEQARKEYEAAKDFLNC